MENYQEYKAKYGDLFDAQILLEDEAKSMAEERMRLALDEVRRNGEAGEGKLAGRFIESAWQTCRANIRALLASASKPNKTIQGLWVAPMKDLIRIYQDKPEELENLLVLTSLSVTISMVMFPSAPYKKTVSNIAGLIGNAIRQESELESFFVWSAAKGDVKDSWMRNSMDKGIEKRVRSSYRIAYAVHRMHAQGYNGLKWDKQSCVAFGAKILEMVIKGSAYFEMVDQYIDKKKIKSLVASEWFEKAWENNENRLVETAIKYTPTIIPPKPWTTPYDGGYYGAATLGVHLIRLKEVVQTKELREYTRKLGAVDLTNIYSVLNHMQETPFIINKRILQVLKEIYASGGELGGIPRTTPYATLPKLPDDVDMDVLKEHKRKQVAIHLQESARKSRALRAYIALQTAEKCAQYEKIYFPWNIDYRGRCYPIPTAISPQGDDIQKALLLFAEPSPLASDADTKWLAIHGANLAGRDKLPFAGRVAWIEEHEEQIKASAADPLGYTWWSEVAKNDYPMEFLSFCLEWTRLCAYKDEHGTAAGFVTGLPIAFDGTCSGLQHFSGLLRDEIGGAAVNLLPSDNVQDIYSIVADKVNTVLLKDAQSGTADGYKYDKQGNVVNDQEGKPHIVYGTKTLAQNWVSFNRLKYSQDGITRKVCKRSVMTLAYGSKLYGFKENLLSDIIKPFVLEHPDENPFVSPIQAATYMARLIWEAVGTTVVKAVEGMAWLQKVAELICKEGHVVTWTTPNGLPVQQNYMCLTQEVMKLRFNRARVRFYTQVEQEGVVDTRRQAQGISPNFIHSMDAAHLQRVVNAEYSKGNANFMMIHDSFGTDAAHAGQLFKTIREEFIGLYKDQNYLQDFLEQVSYLINDDDMDKIPKIPSFGTLDLEEVKKSDFCFA